MRTLLIPLIVYLLCFRLGKANSSGIGPNICPISPGVTRCCPGWTNSLGGLCTTAICNGNCGEQGSCIAPNQCKCEDGGVKRDCTMEDDEFLADEPVRCPSNCNNQGICTDGRCVCDLGFKGSACDEETIGPCFVQVKRGICRNKISGLNNETALLTRSICCGSIGVAWGELCQSCTSRRSYCARGYIHLNHRCVDINECEIPKVCAGGVCRNTEGSFECDCPYSYRFDKATLQCQPVHNGCQKNPKACIPGGRCVPLQGGTYACQCEPGYAASDGNTRCLKKEAVWNYCEIFEGKLCKNGECHATASSYECTCNPGYEPNLFKKHCIKEFNSCTLYGSSICSNGKCMPVGRGFRCICNHGYAPSSEGTACLDKCQQLGPSVCQNGFCVTRLYGDYECRCHYGYQLSSDRKSCLMQSNPTQSLKRSSWSNEKNYRYSFQADWPHEKKASNNLQPQIIQPRWLPTAITHHPDPCDNIAIRRRCMGGFCLNIGFGLYECKCYKGYRAVNANQQCLADYRGTSLQRIWPPRAQRQEI